MPLEFTCFDDCPDNNGFGYNSPFSDEYYLPTKKSIPMQLLQNKLQAELEKFRVNFRSINVRVDNDYLVYSYKNIRHAVTSCADANFLITKMNLDLVAIHNINATSFIVQSNLISYI